MKEIKKLFEPLNLIYYEYDAKENLFTLDKEWSREHILDELIKITHTLTSNNIKFYVDENQSIVLKEKSTLEDRLKRYFQALYAYVRNSRMNIYVLSDKKVKWAKNLPVFGVKYLKESIAFGEYEALVFTSKNAILALKSQGKEWKKIPSYVIAPQSAKVLKSMGGSLKFVGKENHGDAFANEIIGKLKGKKVLYVRGRSVISDLVNILNTAGVLCDEQIVYETQCKEMQTKKKLPKGAMIIFSSPSTIECFFKNMQWDESYRAIAIGKTTASHFPSYITPYIADTTSLESCVKKAIELENKGHE